ncbi:hypothetical protein AAF134_01365 [Synechococcus lacustris Tous-12m]
MRRFVVTPANIHDSQMLPMLLDPDNQDDYIWADSAILTSVLKIYLA